MSEEPKKISSNPRQKDISIDFTQSEIRELKQKEKNLDVPITFTSAVSSGLDPAVYDISVGDSKIGKSWSGAWGSVKASFGAGLEWYGIKHDFDHLKDYGRELKEKGIRQQIANWQDVAEWEGFESLLDSDWWETKAPSILPSVISLIAPNLVAGYVGGTMTAAGLSAALPAVVAEPTPVGEILYGAAVATGATVAAAGVSRTLEGVMEAGGSWMEVMDELVEQGKTKEEAEEMASQAASEVFRKNYNLMGMDAIQFALGFTPLRLLGKMKKFQTIGKTVKAFDKIVPRPAQLTASILGGMATEATEEIYQQWISSQAIHRATGKEQESWDEFISNPENVEAGVLGAVGGLGFQSMALARNIKGKHIKSAAEKIVKTGKKLIRKVDEVNEVMDEYNKAETQEEKNDIQKQYALVVMQEHVLEGREEVLKDRLRQEFESGKITSEQQQDYLKSLDSIKKTHEAMGDISTEKKEKIFDLIRKKELINEKIDLEETQAKENSTPEDVLKARIDPFKENLKELTDEIQTLLRNPPKTAEAENKKTEKKSEEKKFTAKKLKEEKVEAEKTSEKKKFTAKKTPTFEELVNRAETEKELDAILDQSDAANQSDLNLVEKISKKREELRNPPKQEKTEKKNEPIAEKPKLTEREKYFSEVEKISKDKNITPKQKRERILQKAIKGFSSKGKSFQEYVVKSTPTLAGVKVQENQIVIQKNDIKPGDVLNVQIGEPINYTTNDGINRTDDRPVDIVVNGERIGGLQRDYDQKQEIADLIENGENVKAVITDATSKRINFRFIVEKSGKKSKRTSNDIYEEPDQEPAKRFTAKKLKEETAKLSKIDKINEKIAQAKEAEKKAFEKLRNKSGLQSGVPLQNLPEMLEFGKEVAKRVALQNKKGLLLFGEWSMAMIEKLGDSIIPHLKDIFNKIDKPTRKNSEKIKRDEILRFIEQSIIFDGHETEGASFRESDQRVEYVLNVVRDLYKDSGIEDEKVMDVLYDVVNSNMINEKDIAATLDAMINKGGAYRQLGLHLSEYKNEELVSLFVAFKNLRSVPFVYASKRGKDPYQLYLSNSKEQILASLTTQAKKKINSFTKEKYEKNVRIYNRKRQIKEDNFRKANSSKNRTALIDGQSRTADELKAEIYYHDLHFMKFHTDLDWTAFADSNKDVPQGKTYEEFFLTSTYNAGNKIVHNVNTPIRQFLIMEKKDIARSYESFKRNLIKKGKGSQLGALARASSQKTTGAPYAYLFDNVEMNQKTGMLLSSQLTDDATKIHHAKGKGHNSNKLVSYFKEKKSPMNLVVLDGIRGQSKKGIASGKIMPLDFLSVMIMGYNDTIHSSEGEYLQILEQFSDKKQSIMGNVPLYSNEELSKEIKSILSTKTGKRDFPSEKKLEVYAKNLKETVDNLISDGSIKVNGDVNEFLNGFVKNYAINKFYSDLYFHGSNDNYLTKDKSSTDYIDQSKRAGSTASSGLVGNTEIEGGIGKRFNHVILEDYISSFNVGKHSFTNKEITDGAGFISEQWSNKHKISFGSIYDYHTSLKGIFSEIDPQTLERTLIKSHAIVLTKKMATDYPGLMPIYNMMINNQVDMVTFQSGVKKQKGETTKVKYHQDGSVDSISKAKVISRSTENWRVQQDLRDDTQMKERSVTRQMLRHFMEFENMSTVQNLFDKAAQMRESEVDKILNDPDDTMLREMILENIPDVDQNQQMREMISEGISLSHPHISAYITSVVGSIIKRNVLSIKINGARYTEIPPVGGMDLKSMRIEDGKVLLPEVLVPIDSGLAINDEVFVTRVPSSLHHSTHLMKVVGYVDRNMGNVIITDKGSSAISGADYDGDQRYLWGKYKDNEGIDLKSEDTSSDPKKIMNRAFDLMAEEYKKPENFGKIVQPIDTSVTEKIIKKGEVVPPNKYLLGSLIKMYQNNRDSQIVIGIVARSSAVQSWLKAHGSTMRIPIAFPINKSGKKGLGYFSLFDKSDDTSIVIANNVNHAIDDPKLQNLELMGMNEINAGIYNAIEQLGVKEEDVISFFKSGTIKEFVRFAREVKSEISKLKKSKDVFKLFAEKIDPGSTKPIGKYSRYYKLNMDQLLNRMNDNDEIASIVYLKKLHNAFFQYSDVSRLINLTEEPSKNFTEDYQATNAIKRISLNKGSIDLNELGIGSIYVEPAIMSTSLYKMYALKNSLEYTESMQLIIKRIEENYRNSKIHQKSSNYQTTAMPVEMTDQITRTIRYMAIIEALAPNASRKVVQESTISKYKKLKEKENLFIDSLEITDGKLGLATSFRGLKNIENIEAIKDAFNELSESDKDAFAVYNAFEYGYTQSGKRGGFSLLFSNDYHKEIGSKIEKIKTSWNSIEQTNIDRLYKKAISLNPYLLPEVELQDNPNGIGKVIVSNNRLDKTLYPKTVIAYSTGDKKQMVYKLFRTKGTNNYYYSSEKRINLQDFQNEIEDKLQLSEESNESNLPDVDIKEQSYYDENEALLKEDPIYSEHVMNKIAKKYPDVKIFQDVKKFMEYVEKHVGPDKTIDEIDALGAAFKDAIYINPKKAVQSTPLHEMAHLYFDALPSGDSLKTRLLDLFDNNEEKLIQTIAEAAVNIEKAAIPSGTVARFKALLKLFWQRVKALFSTKEALVQDLATELLENPNQFKGSDFNANFVRYMAKRAIVSEDVKKERKKRLIDEIKEFDENFDGDLSSISYKHIDSIFSKDLEKQGDNLRDHVYYETYQRLPKKEYILDGSKPIYLPLEKVEYAPMVNRKINLAKWMKKRNKTLIDNMYEKYKKDMLLVDSIWEDIDTQEKFDQISKRKDFDNWLLNRIHVVVNLDPRAAQDLKTFLINTYIKTEFVKNVSKENEKGYEGITPYTNALWEISTNEMMSSWLNHHSEIISGKYTMMSPFAVKEKILQLRQYIINNKYYQVLERQNEMRTEMERLGKRVKKEKGDLNWLIVKSEKGIEFFAEYDSIKFTNVKDSHGGKPGWQAVEDWAKAYTKYYYQLSNSNPKNGLLRIPRVDADNSELLIKKKLNYWEILKYKKAGDLKAKAVSDSSDEINPRDIGLDDIIIDVPKFGGNITLRDAKIREMEEADNGNVLKKASAVFNVTRYTNQANQILRSASDGGMAIDKGGNYIIHEESERMNTGITFTNNKFKTENAAAVAVKYFNSLIFEEEMMEIKPYLHFVQEFMGNNQKENIKRWLEIQDNDLLYNKKPRSNFSAVEKYIQFLVNYTAWKYLGLNPSGAFFNLSAGITNSFVHVGPGAMFKGLKRLLSKFSVNKDMDLGFVVSKGINGMRKFNVVNTSQDAELSISQKTITKISNIVFSPITFIEYMNQSFTFYGLMEDENWHAYDKDWNLITGKEKEAYIKRFGHEPKELTEANISTLLNDVRLYNGSYHPLNKRGINKTVEGRALMQFKNWMPDIVLSHIQREYEDMDDVIRKGILNSVVSNKAWNLFKSVFTGDARKNWEELPEIDKINFKKFAREFISIMMMAYLYSLVSDDKEKERTFGRILGDIGFIYDIDNATFLLDGPSPVLGVIADGLKTAKEVFKVGIGQGARYERDAKYGKTGDLKAIVMIANMSPANKIIKHIWADD